jgi:hypothetical protein
VVGLLAVALATTGTVGIAMLRSYLVQQIDDQLSVGAARVVANPALPVGTSAPPPSTQLPTPFVFAQLSPSGALLQQRGGFGTNPAGTPGAQPVLSGITHTVTVEHNGSTDTVRVTVGLTGEAVSEIKSGLEPGDKVVLADNSQSLPESTSSGNTGLLPLFGNNAGGPIGLHMGG